MISMTVFVAHHPNYSFFYDFRCLRIRCLALTVIDSARWHLVKVNLIKVLLSENRKVRVSNVLDESPYLYRVTDRHKCQQQNIIGLERQLISVRHK